MLLPLPTCIDNQLQESRHFGFVWLHATATSLNLIPPETKISIFFQIFYSFDVFTKLRGQAPARTDAPYSRQAAEAFWLPSASRSKKPQKRFAFAGSDCCLWIWGENLCKETVQATVLRKIDVVDYDRLMFSFLWIEPGPLLLPSYGAVGHWSLHLLPERRRGHWPSSKDSAAVGSRVWMAELVASQARTVQTICKNITAQRQGREDRSLLQSREIFERYWMRWAASHIDLLVVNYWWSPGFKLQTIKWSGGFCVNKRMALFQLEIFRSVGRSRTSSRSLSRTDKSLGIDPGQNNSGYSRDIRLLRSANALSIWGGFPFRTVQIMVILYKGPEMPSFLVLFWCIPASS